MSGMAVGNAADDIEISDINKRTTAMLFIHLLYIHFASFRRIYLPLDTLI
jgi:hypothetical protein